MLYLEIRKKVISSISLIVLLMLVSYVGVGCAEESDKTGVGNAQINRERLTEESANYVKVTSAAIKISEQEAINPGCKVFATDYFTIEAPDGWSAVAEQNEYTFALNLYNEMGIMAGRVEMLPQGADVMQLIPSDSHKEILHEDKENGQKTTITVFCTDQVDEQKAAIIADIMSDSLKNTGCLILKSSKEKRK